MGWEQRRGGGGEGGKLMRYGWAVVAVVDRKEQISFFDLARSVPPISFSPGLFLCSRSGLGSTMGSLGVGSVGVGG